MERWAKVLMALGCLQAVLASSNPDNYEPMVAFICDRPAMHRVVNGWVPDASTNCLNKMEDILAYCQTMYPDHNITNVVEASYMVNITNWPMRQADRSHYHRVRPFRCLMGGFQSDALLVPQHCEFDHRHDQTQCKDFFHWKEVATQACTNKEMHLESYGMLLNCNLAMFSGVEYVCCPNQVATRYHPVQEDDSPDSWEDDSSDESDESDEDEDEDEDEWDEDDDEEEDSSEEEEDDDDQYTSDSYPSTSQEVEENTIDYYEAYLRQQPFPARYNNEHKKFLAAKERMKKNQQRKTTKLLQEWQAARDHVNEVRKGDPKRAEDMSEQIAKRFQNLYASYQQEDEAEKQQLLAVHQQHVQAALNERKRDAMDNYMKALEKKDVEKIVKYLQGYVKAEEKDRMHTVNHFEHVKYSNAHEALRIHPFIVNHLKLSEQRIDQALQLLSRYPDIDASVRPQIDEFMTRFDAIANSIRNVVLPVPEVEQEEEQGVDLNTFADDDDEEDIRTDDNGDFDMSEESDEDDILENEHDYEPDNHFAAHAQDNTMQAKQGVVHTATHGSQLGSSLGIALGGVSVFVIIVVAIVMVRRNNRSHANNPLGYVESPTHDEEEVDPSATPEERHLANMQMNGYENPTYKYFEVQSNPKA